MMDPATGEIVDGPDEESAIVHVQNGAVAAIVKSEVEAQLDAAHKYPRSIARFLQDAKTLASVNEEVAASCIFSMPRDGKMITGPSVRLAEICASCYGNMHYGGRVVGEDDKTVTSQGGAWDLQRNVRVTIETKRRITGKNGRKYSDDMIVMTGNAAASIAMRNAIFRVVPRALVDQVYDHVRKVAVGDAQTLSARRVAVLERLAKIGVSRERVLARLGKTGPDDIGLEELEVLIGLGTAIKNGDQQIDEAFPQPAPPPAAPSEDGRRISLKKTTPQNQPPPGRDPGQEG